MTREELKQDIEAYNTVRDTTNPHVTYFIKEYKERAEKDGITLLQMNLPSSLVAIHPEIGLLTNSDVVDEIDDISEIFTHVFVAKTQSVYGGVKTEKVDERYDCLENGYWYSSEQLYDMLRIRKAKGYDIAALFDFGVVDTDTDNPWLMLRYASLSFDYTIESLEREIQDKWK